MLTLWTAKLKYIIESIYIFSFCCRRETIFLSSERDFPTMYCYKEIIFCRINCIPQWINFMFYIIFKHILNYWSNCQIRLMLFLVNKNTAKLATLNGKITVNVQTTHFSCYASLRVSEQILFTPNNPGKFV